MGFTPCKAEQPLRHGVTRKEAQKRSQDTENLFRENLQLKDATLFNINFLHGKQVAQYLLNYKCYQTLFGACNLGAQIKDLSRRI